MARATSEVTMPLDLFKSRVNAAHIAGLKEARELLDRQEPWRLVSSFKAELTRHIKQLEGA